MTQSKKYSFRITNNGDTWSAEIIRRASSKKSIITKTQDGFSTEPEATEWAQKEITLLLQNMNRSKMEKRRARKQE